MAGSGSMQKRGKKSWYFTVSCGLDKNKKPIRKTKTFHGTKREAETALAEFIVEVERGYYIKPSKLTFRDFVDLWRRDYATTNLSPKTLHRYQTILESRVFPVLGDKKIKSIQPTDLLEFYRQLQEEVKIIDDKEYRLAPRTILHHHRVISAILEDAVKWRIIPSNPARSVDAPKVPPIELTVYDEEQTKAMITALADEPLKFKTLTMLAVATGLRQGELFGLEWEDVDFDNKLIHVRRVSGYTPEKGIYTKEPKNRTSRRTIAVPATVLEILRLYKVKQNEDRLALGDKWNGSPRLFTTWEGKPMLPTSMSDWFPRFLKRKGLPHMNFHGLRHLAATFMIAKGAPIKNVSARLGHARVSTTLDIYSHALKSVDKEIAEQMEGLFKTTEVKNPELKHS